jgi:Domain of unknown function (DUF7008)/Eco57I restriction-modification methylase
MIDSTALLEDLKRQVKNLEADLRQTGAVEADTALREEWQEARQAGRTAAAFEQWLPERVTQVAVAWILATVFVRFCEDNGLLEQPFIAGPGTRLDQARELREAFFAEHPGQDYYHWVTRSFDAMSVAPVAKSLFDRARNPMWTIKPTPYAIKDLVEFWRTVDQHGQLVHDFQDDDWGTRFLGDLYQDLSDDIRDKYALLQTPEFVEEFILKYTLDPAIEEFGLEPEPPHGHERLPRRLRVIDPACGSGHFLLGAFHHLLRAWQDASGDTDRWKLINNAMTSVHGVDKNPYAVAIARFRLMLAGMRAGGVDRLDEQVDFPLNIAVGDSLLHGFRSYGSEDELPYGEKEEDEPAYTYRTEDIGKYIKSVHILAFGSYHAVFANPPYITVRDEAENNRYRKFYLSCYRQYSLSVPFAERIFKLAIRGSLQGVGAGYTGQITANSFMKREFGKKLIEEYFAHQVNLTQVIDSSGAYIPGHGTPTVILFGRTLFPRRGSTIRAVLGVRGEVGVPDDPAHAPVWQAIVTQVDQPGSESVWATVSDAPRGQFAKHPWSLSGGGAENLKMRLESAPRGLIDLIEEIGFGAVTREDDAYMLGSGPLNRFRIPATYQRPLVEGDTVRDYGIGNPTIALWPYDVTTLDASADSAVQALLWPYRAILRHRVAYGKTQLERGLSWFEYSMFFRKRFRPPFILAFAFVATHNHYVMDRGGKVFNRSAPVIRLPEGATEDDHLELLGVLNSSTACFWLKQVSHDKGNRGGERSTARYAWENFYEFTGTKLAHFPLPDALPLEFGRDLDTLAQRLAAVQPSAVCAEGVPTRGWLDAARADYERIRGRMIALQEELDWDVYHRYGLFTDEEAADLVAAPGSVPDIQLGERAFEFLLAERLDGAEGEKQWFERHYSKPVYKIPAHWPNEYKAVVEKRIAFIENNRNIGLIERPDNKRRWYADPWEVKEKAALRTWLLGRCEERSLWYGPDGQPQAMTVNRLADLLRPDADVVSVARLYAGRDAELFPVLNEIIADEHVPFLAVYRYKGEGLLKRTLWELTWEKQRKEDRTGQRADIDLPPKYTSADFWKTSYWRHRGKLDVPKERFISYPGASPGSDESLLLGWAGWDHREQALALTILVEQRSTVDGWDTERLTALLAGLAEVMPWVRQWHGETDLAFGQSPADALDDYLTNQTESRSLTEEALRTWSPAPPTRRGTRRIR